MATMTPADRLALLLPIVNREPLTEADLRGRLFAFLKDFHARGLRLPAHEQELWDLHHSSAADLKGTAEKVVRLFEWGLAFEGPRPRGLEGMTPDDIRLPLTFPSLRWGVFAPQGRERGRFAQIVEAGRLRDLVPYLALYLLATEETRIARCHAPAFRDWSNECGKVFIWSGVGRPPGVCSKQCGSRVKAKRVVEQARHEREAWRAAQRKEGRPPRISKALGKTTRRKT